MRVRYTQTHVTKGPDGQRYVAIAVVLTPVSSIPGQLEAPGSIDPGARSPGAAAPHEEPAAPTAETDTPDLDRAWADEVLREMFGTLTFPPVC